MSFSATILKILIASPSDLVEERKVIPEIIHNWNCINAEKNKVFLLPLKWETNSAPVLGNRPQEIINTQIVNDCDLLLGFFWTRIGTDTGVAESGTIEEIENFISKKKPVMLYFSSRPVVLESVDIEQYRRLKEFKNKIQEMGLVETYSSIDDLTDKLLRQLSINLNSLGYSDINSIEIENKHQLFTNNNDTSELLEISRNLDSKLLEWKSHTDILNPSIEDARYVIEDVVDLVDDLLESLNQREYEQLKEKLYEIKSTCLATKKMTIYLNGGKSFQDFIGSGNQIFQSLNNIIEKISGSRGQLEGGLDKTKESLLKILAADETNGNSKPRDVSYFKSFIEIPAPTIDYHLNELKKDGMIHMSSSGYGDQSFSLTHMGRSYLYKKGFI